MAVSYETAGFPNREIWLFRRLLLDLYNFLAYFDNKSLVGKKIEKKEFEPFEIIYSQIRQKY